MNFYYVHLVTCSSWWFSSIKLLSNSKGRHLISIEKKQINFMYFLKNINTQ